MMNVKRSTELIRAGYEENEVEEERKQSYDEKDDLKKKPIPNVKKSTLIEKKKTIKKPQVEDEIPQKPPYIEPKVSYFILLGSLVYTSTYYSLS